MSDVVLLVGGKRYGGWKAARVINPMEALAGAFDLEVSDRWGGQGVPWPIAEEDECRVEVAGQVVIDGYIGGRSLAIDAGARSLGYSGKDKAAILVSCSVLLDQWTFRRANVYDIALAVATPFGIPVYMQSGLALPAALPKLEVNPGDTAHQVIERAATASGVLVVSDGAGGILITRAGSARAGLGRLRRGGALRALRGGHADAGDGRCPWGLRADPRRGHRPGRPPYGERAPRPPGGRV
jgi:prophage tail gpP-like protein